MVAQYEVKTALKILLAAPLIILVLFLVSSYFLAMPLGLALFFFTPEGAEVSQLHILKFPIIFDFSIPVAANVGLVFLFLLGVYAVCFVGAWMSRESLHKVVRKGFSHPFKLFNNNLFAMPTITSMLIIAFIVIHVVLGVPTGSGPFEPSEDPLQPFKDFFALTYSPLVEEIGFRVSPIGIFLIAYLFVVGRARAATLSRRELLKTLFFIPLYPDKAKELLGARTVREFGIRGISLAEWIMIVFTSVAFGLAHYFLGVGWEAGKIISVSIDGFAFGLAYLLYGVQAPILMHWFLNYYWSLLFSPDLALKFYPIVSPISFLISFVTLILGVLGWPMFVILLCVWVYRRWKRGVVPQVPPPPLPTPAPPQLIIRFCRRCGRVLSEDMRFCPYCGEAVEEKKKEES